MGTPNAPVTIARCRMDTVGQAEGVVVAGSSQSSQIPTRYIVIRDNRIAGMVRCIHVQGAVADVLIAGNRLTDFIQEGIGTQDLVPKASPDPGREQYRAQLR